MWKVGIGHATYFLVGLQNHQNLSGRGFGGSGVGHASNIFPKTSPLQVIESGSELGTGNGKSQKTGSG